MLAEVGAGSWHPERDTRDWIRFTLVAHHVQAQTVLRRVDEAARLWRELSDLAESRRLPERTLTALFDAASGLRVRRSGYERDAQVEPGTAARDLRMMVAADLLSLAGETRARRYTAAPELREVRNRVAAGRQPIVEPFGVPARTAAAEARNITTSAQPPG